MPPLHRFRLVLMWGETSGVHPDGVLDADLRDCAAYASMGRSLMLRWHASCLCEFIAAGAPTRHKSSLWGYICQSATTQTKDAFLRSAQLEIPCSCRDGKGAVDANKQEVCPKCGISIPEGGAQEHEDYHLALALQGGDPPLAPRQQAGKWEGGRGKKRKPPPPPAITKFFKPSRAGST